MRQSCSRGSFVGLAEPRIDREVRARILEDDRLAVASDVDALDARAAGGNAASRCATEHLVRRLVDDAAGLREVVRRAFVAERELALRVQRRGGRDLRGQVGGGLETQGLDGRKRGVGGLAPASRDPRRDARRSPRTT